MYAVNLYLVLLGFIIVIPCQVYVLHGVNSQLYHLYSEYATYGRFSYSLTPGSGLASVFSVASTTPVPCSTVPKFCHFLLHWRQQNFDQKFKQNFITVSRGIAFASSCCTLRFELRVVVCTVAGATPRARSVSRRTRSRAIVASLITTSLKRCVA